MMSCSIISLEKGSDAAGMELFYFTVPWLH